MADFTPEVCHYFRETIDPNANSVKEIMAHAAVIIVSKGTVTKQPFCNRHTYSYKGVAVIEDCFGEYVIKVPEDSHGFPDTRYLKAIIIDDGVHPLIIGKAPRRV